MPETRSIVRADREYEAEMQDSSRKLLAALWASHPWIMQSLGARRP